VFILLSSTAEFIPSVLSANVGAIAGSLFVMFFNYAGYKYIVFK
jgi:hypothetical protein